MRKLLLRHGALPSFCAIVLFAVMAFCVEIYSIHCENSGRIPVYAAGDIAQRYQPPSPEHWLGTDYQGRDVFWRAAAGSATAMKVGLIAGIIAAVIGTFLGLIAGFYGGWADNVTVWLYSTFAAMPALLFILAFALLVKGNFMSGTMSGIFAAAGVMLHAEPGMLAVYLAIGLTSWVTLCRVVRAETMRLKKLPYVSAAYVCGQRPFVIMLKYMLPNVFHLVIIYFTLTFASAVMSEVIVSYLGVGVQSAPSWGVMISDGQDRLWRGIWWEVAAATGFMFALVLALNIFGDRLRDMLDPRNR